MNAQSPNNETEAQAVAAEATDLPLISAEDWAERKRLAKPGMQRRMKLFAICILCLPLLGFCLVLIGCGIWGLVLIFPLIIIGTYLIYPMMESLSRRFNLLCPNCEFAFTYSGWPVKGFALRNLERGGRCPKCNVKILDSNKPPLDSKKIIRKMIVPCASLTLIILAISFGADYLLHDLMPRLQWIPVIYLEILVVGYSFSQGVIGFGLAIFLPEKINPVKTFIRWLTEDLSQQQAFSRRVARLACKP